MQDGTRVSLLVDQRLNADGLPSERGTLKVPDDAGIGITGVLDTCPIPADVASSSIVSTRKRSGPAGPTLRGGSFQGSMCCNEYLLNELIFHPLGSPRVRCPPVGESAGLAGSGVRLRIGVRMNSGSPVDLFFKRSDQMIGVKRSFLNTWVVPQIVELDF